MKLVILTSISLASALALAATARAAVVGPASGMIDGVAAATVLQANAGGIGHVNLVPYYTVLNGFDTYLNVTNTDTRNGKAVKVRFRTGANADTVFDFTLLLAPGDTWAAAVTRDSATGLPRLAPADTSCTLPAAIEQPFGTGRLAAWPDRPLAAQASEGQVEILTMADILPASALMTAITTPLNVASPPCTAGALAVLSTDPLSYADARSKGLDVPTTGLFTQWTLINVPRAASYTGVAAAVEARTAVNGTAGYGNVVFSPQTATPLPMIGALREQTADPLLRGAVTDNAAASGQSLAGVSPDVGAVYSDLPDLSTPYLPAWLGQLGAGVATRLQAHAVSKLFAAATVSNQYVVDPGIEAKTEWIFTFPTRRFNVAAKPATGEYRYTNWTVDDGGAPLGQGTINYFVPVNMSPSDGPLVCMHAFRHQDLPLMPASERNTSTLYTDRAGHLAGNISSLLSPLGDFHRLCGTTSVTRFQLDAATDLKPLTGSHLTAAALRLLPKAGWVRLLTAYTGQPSLPLIGFAALELFNSAATPGMAGTYGLTFLHATTPAP